MFDRFTDPAKEAMNLARRAALSFDVNCLDVEHMLYGLLSVNTCAASRMLEANGMRASSLLRDLTPRMRRGTSKLAAEARLPFTPEGKRALEVSMMTAARLGHEVIGTGHLLLGVCMQDSPAVLEWMRTHSLDMGRLEEALARSKDEPEHSPNAREGRRGPPDEKSGQLATLRSAFMIALELGDEAATRALFALIQKFESELGA